MNQCDIDNAIVNIYLQNEHLSTIIKNGLILPPNMSSISNIVPESQRLMYFKRLISNLKNNAKKSNREICVNITEKDLNDIYLRQNGKCALTKKDLTFNYTNKVSKYKGVLNKVSSKEINDFNISISRIDNNKPYEYKNTQLIACRISLMKNKLSNNNFIKLCNYVVTNSKQ